MLVEGQITTVAETAPLQLSIETSSGRYEVGLQPDTRLTQAGQPLDPGALQPGTWVRIRGQISGPRTLTAQHIDVLAERQSGNIDPQARLVLVEGQITTVAETAPLQLSIETSSGRYEVGLQPDTRLTQAGQPLDPGALQPGTWVRIRGQISGPRTLTAQHIDILP